MPDTTGNNLLIFYVLIAVSFGFVGGWIIHSQRPKKPSKEISKAPAEYAYSYGYVEVNTTVVLCALLAACVAVEYARERRKLLVLSRSLHQSTDVQKTASANEAEKADCNLFGAVGATVAGKDCHCNKATK